MAPRSRATGRTPAARRGRVPASPAPVPPRLAAPSPRQREAIRAVVDQVVTGMAYDLEELTVSRAGRRYVVRVMVDGDGGVGLDDIAEVSRAVSAALDEAEATGGELHGRGVPLEVSSPGVDRPLTLPRHWRRNVGRLVKVTMAGRAGDRPGDRGRRRGVSLEWTARRLDACRTPSWARAGAGGVHPAGRAGRARRSAS